jgi:hypothetical protein
MDLSTREPSIPKSNHEASARDEATKLPSLQQCSDHSTPYFIDAVPYTPGLVTEYPDSGVLQKDSIGPDTESHGCIWSDRQLENGQNPQEEAAARIYGIADISSHTQPLTLRSKPPSDSSARPQLRGRKRSASPISIPGYQCFDWNIKLEQLGPQLEPQPRKRPKRKTRTQREEANRVREKGACLRCYVQKLKVYNIHLSIWIFLMQSSALKGFLVYLVQSYSARLRRLSEQERCSGQHV